MSIGGPSWQRPDPVKAEPSTWSVCVSERLEKPVGDAPCCSAPIASSDSSFPFEIPQLQAATSSSAVTEHIMQCASKTLEMFSQHLGHVSSTLGRLAQQVSQQRNLGLTRSNSEYVQDLVSFTGQEKQLLRASDLTVCLSGVSRIFANSQGSADTYSLSRNVETIDCFISHNWSVHRFVKFMCLVLHFNMQRALLVTSIAILPLVVASALGATPTYELPDDEYPSGYVIRITLPPVFVLSLLFCHMFDYCSPFRRPTVFLDKTCIHQTDDNIQRLGIKKLAAFLMQSRTMLVIFSEVYLSKLWTVYELASFLTVCKNRELALMPVFMPKVLLAGILCMWIASIASIVLTLYQEAIWVPDLAMCLLMYGFGFTLRKEARFRRDMFNQLAAFSVTSCTCACEDDRPLVYQNIAALIRGSQPGLKQADEEDALACFDELVKRELPRRLAVASSKHGLSYRNCVVLFALTGLPYALEAVVRFQYGLTMRVFLSMACIPVCMTFHAAPVWVAIVTKVSTYKLHWRGCKEALFVVCAVMAGNVWLGAVGALLLAIYGSAVSDAPGAHWAFAGQWVLIALLSCVTYAVFRRPPEQRAAEPRVCSK